MLNLTVIKGDPVVINLAYNVPPCTTMIYVIILLVGSPVADETIPYHRYLVLEEKTNKRKQIQLCATFQTTVTEEQSCVPLLFIWHNRLLYKLSVKHFPLQFHNVMTSLSRLNFYHVDLDFKKILSHANSSRVQNPVYIQDYFRIVHKSI